MQDGTDFFCITSIFCISVEFVYYVIISFVVREFVRAFIYYIFNSNKHYIYLPTAPMSRSATAAVTTLKESEAGMGSRHT